MRTPWKSPVLPWADTCIGGVIQRGRINHPEWAFYRKGKLRQTVVVGSVTGGENKAAGAQMKKGGGSRRLSKASSSWSSPKGTSLFRWELCTERKATPQD